MSASPFARAEILLALALMTFATGCGSGSSSSSAAHTTSSTAASSSVPGPYLLVKIRNDTSATVQFNQCTTTCDKTHERRTLPAGGENSIAGMNNNETFAYVVNDAAGKRLGCVYMRFNKVKLEPTVLISSMTACK